MFGKCCRVFKILGPQKKMGALVCMPADLSALQKQTILNTRANKFRNIIDRSSVSKNEEITVADSALRSECQGNHKFLSVGFCNIVHERVYFKQGSNLSPKLKDKDNILANVWNRRECYSRKVEANSGPNTSQWRLVSQQKEQKALSLIGVASFPGQTAHS